MQEQALQRLDQDLWVASRPLALWVGDIGCRMTVIRLADGGLLLHSPVPFDAATRAAVDAVGAVRWLVGPSAVHHFYLGDWAEAYPDAQLVAAPGLPEKREDLSFDVVLGEDGSHPWGEEIRTRFVPGAPRLNEVVFLHPASRTLVLTDLAFNVKSGPGNRARLFHRLIGATDRFGPHRMIRAFIRDGATARAAIDEILGWEFDRVIVGHGEVREKGGREALAEGFAYLG